jgi:hypothetical protein
MKQLRLLSFVVLVLLVAAYPIQNHGRRVTAAERTPQTNNVLQPLIMTSELAVGQNRLAFGLLKDHQLIADADVTVRVYAIHGQQAQLQAAMKATYDKLEGIEQGRRVHVHADGTRHVHSEETEALGLYVTQVSFERPGTWGLEIVAKQSQGSDEISTVAVDVLAVSHTPALGSPAPRSRNLIAGEVSELRQIDTSDPPDPRLHQVRIADAIAQGRPQVIVFATPKFCTSRMCGPVVDVVRTLLPRYGDRVIFTHQEIWQDLSAQKLSPTVVEWSLPSEPWIFVVDAKGIIRAKFEGLTTARELETALKATLEVDR